MITVCHKLTYPVLFLGVLYALGLLPNAGTLMTGLAAGCTTDPSYLRTLTFQFTTRFQT